jgi:hypothetical protein
MNAEEDVIVWNSMNQPVAYPEELLCSILIFINAKYLHHFSHEVLDSILLGDLD